MDIDTTLLWLGPLTYPIINFDKKLLQLVNTLVVFYVPTKSIFSNYVPKLPLSPWQPVVTQIM